MAEETGATILGTSAAYLTACAKADVEPGRSHGLERLRALCYTGSPLVPDLWGWAYEHVRRDLWMSSISGGTDVCVPFVGGLPTLPVRAGEFQLLNDAWDCMGAVRAGDDNCAVTILADFEHVRLSPQRSYRWCGIARDFKLDAIRAFDRCF